MDTLTRQALMAHRAILEKLIDRVTSLERLLCRDAQSDLYGKVALIDLAKCPPFDTDDEKIESDA